MSRPAPILDTARPAFVLLSFEGPDDYSRAGGLGSRVSGLAWALAQQGHETHLFYVGAPEAPGCETIVDGRLHLHRWCQWISRFHPGGVYDGEEGKLHDWNASLVPWLECELLPQLLERHARVIVIAEEWQTSASVAQLAEAIAQTPRWSGRVRCYWNANNTFGFDRVPWKRLAQAATVTTVSRFMKHEMWRFGVDAHVIPNGIANEWLQPWDRTAVHTIKRSVADRLLLVKVARWDPDKRWLMAIDAIGELKSRGTKPLLLARGGVESHGRDVVERAKRVGLTTASVTCPDKTPATLARAIAAAPASDVLFLERPLSRAQLQCLYRASHGVLANSGMEPFGLVGLEAMACGGVSFLGATGEDYASPGYDSISLQSGSPSELVAHLMYLRTNREVETRLRHHARRTAARYTWDHVIRAHMTPMMSIAA